MLQSPASKLQFSIVREIRADAAEVFEILTSEAGMRSWVPLCRSAQWRLAPGATAPSVGSVRYIVLTGGIVAAERITAWDAGRELQYSFDESSLPLATLTRDYVGVTRVEPAGAGRARLSWNIHFNAPGKLALLAPVLRMNLRLLIGMMAGRIVRLAEVRPR